MIWTNRKIRKPTAAVLLAIAVICIAVALLSCAAPEPLSTRTPYPTWTPAPTATAYPTYTPLPTYTPYPTYTSVPAPTSTPRPTATPRPTRTPTPVPISPPRPVVWESSGDWRRDGQYEQTIEENLKDRRDTEIDVRAASLDATPEGVDSDLYITFVCFGDIRFAYLIPYSWEVPQGTTSYGFEIWNRANDEFEDTLFHDDISLGPVDNFQNGLGQPKYQSAEKRATSTTVVQ